MNFNLLRTQKVDVLRYLPKFLANDTTFKVSQDSLSEEHEKLRLLIIDLCRQMFVESATWGLDDWERVYGIAHNPNATDEERRNMLLIKMQGTATISIAKLNELVNLVAPSKDVIVLENTKPNQFKVLVNTPVSVKDIREVVEIYKPAHLAYLVAHQFTCQSAVHILGAVKIARRISIKQAENDGIIRTKLPNISTIGAVSTLHTLHINQEDL